MMKAMLMAHMQQEEGGSAAVKPEKIKGTQIKQQKGGGMVRVVTSDGKEFPIQATKAVYKYLKSIGEEVPEPQKQGVKKVMKKQKEKKEKTSEELETIRQKEQERHQATIAKEGRKMAG